MKIWIDFANTPQVSFWIPFIKEFKNENHELILTCRDSGNTVELLKQQGLDYHIIGDRVGKGTIQKLLHFFNRLIKLYKFIAKSESDVAASQSSFYQPIIAWKLRIPSLYTNDNEHAKGNIFGFLFAKKVILPIALENEAFSKKWPLKSKVSFYPSVKEAIYLSQQAEYLSINKKRRVIYFRPEPWSAQYYKGPLNFFDDTILSLSSDYKVTVLPRDKNQVKHYKKLKGKNLNIAKAPLTFKEILSNCMLFIGAGGSMTRELAVMGTPAISIYQEEMLSVDKYLVDKGLMVIKPNISFDEIKISIVSKARIVNDLSVLNEGKESYKIIKNLIINLKQ